MATDSHGGGGKKEAPEWATKLLVVALAAFLVISGVIMFSNWVTGSSNTASRVVIIDGRATEQRIVRPDGTTVVTTPARTRSHVPTPEQVARSVPHRRERIPVDCVDTHTRVEGSNRCASIRWIPGND